MDSREAGLVLMHHLLDIEDLHYGLWEEDIELNLRNIKTAQQRYTDRLLTTLPSADSKEGGIRVIDIGCGTGTLLVQMLDAGYSVDAVSPSDYLSERVKCRLADRQERKTALYECRLEDLPVDQRNNQYDVALFSESFQYIPLSETFTILPQLLTPGGRVIICDFFRTDAHGDGAPGDGSFGGGHPISDFYRFLDDSQFVIIKDDDITHLTSPNLKVVNDLLMNKIKPSSDTIARFLKDNYPLIHWIITRVFRKKLTRLNYKYFSGFRSQETFEKYKTYHLIVLEYKGE